MARLPELARLTMLGTTLWVAGAAAAQPVTPPPAPSPFAPGDLKRPIFDTQTPVYNKSNAQAKSANLVVAEVDGRAVTLGEIADAIKGLPSSVQALPFDDLFPGVLRQLIEQQALVIRAQQQGLDEDPAIRRKIKASSDRIMADELLRNEIAGSITEQALLDRYQKDVAGKPGAEEVRVRIIMTNTEKAARDIIGELRGGADFATIAKRSSIDATAPMGGDLGYVQRESLNAEVGAVAFAVQPGQVAPFPVRSMNAWFVVKAEDRRQRATPTFAEVREQLKEAVLRERVPDVIAQSLASVTVREYDINGKEAADQPR